MEALLIYALKAAACLLLFYLFFKLLLCRETFHRLNRIAVLAGVLLSFVLPLCVVTITREVVVAAAALQPQLSVDLPTVVVVPTAEPFPWERLAAGIYVAGAVLALLRMAVSLVGVARIIRSGRRERLADGSVLVRLHTQEGPFSWWRYVVASDDDLAENGAAILAHEQAHVRLHHSADLLLFDLAGCLQWFNPAWWLLRRDLQAIHEYEADEAVLAGGADARSYQMLLIKKAVGERWCSVANSFNHSNLKNRITMMTCKRSSRWAASKMLLLLPLLGLALGAFAEVVNVPVVDKDSENSPTAEISAEKSAARRVRLHVADAAGKSLAGAIIREQGAADGVVTDASGNAELQVADPATLEVQQVGFETVVIRLAGNRAEMNGSGSIGIRIEEADGEAVTTSIELKLMTPAEQRAAIAAAAQSAASSEAPAAAAAAASAAAKSAVEKEGAFLMAEQMPTFNGGDLNSFTAWLSQQMVEAVNRDEARYPKVDGAMIFSFVVEIDGSIGEVTPLRVGEGLEPVAELAAETIRTSKVWTPGYQNGKPVRVKYTVPVRMMWWSDEDEAARGMASKITIRGDERNVEFSGDAKGLAAFATGYRNLQQPLFIVDGTVCDDLEKVDKTQIVKISVHRGDSAVIESYVAKYGERARNGVVVITLKNSETASAFRIVRKQTAAQRLRSQAALASARKQLGQSRKALATARKRIEQSREALQRVRESAAVRRSDAAVTL